MQLSAQQSALLEKYDHRDILGLIRIVEQVKNAPDYMATYRRLLAKGRLTSSSVKLEQLATALIDELEEILASSPERAIQANYFEVGEHIKKKFGANIAEIYLASKMPDDFLTAVRQDPEHGDSKKLSDDLVDEYKNALIRIEKGRRLMSDLLQPYSNFPLKNAAILNAQFNQLYNLLKSNYKYLSVKPYLIKIIQLMLGDEQNREQEQDAAQIEFNLFREYQASGPASGASKPDEIHQQAPAAAGRRLCQNRQSHHLCAALQGGRHAVAEGAQDIPGAVGTNQQR
jgi:hypothetical protein